MNLESAIAVIGMSGRFSLSPTVDDLWENLISGRDCLQSKPADRALLALEGFVNRSGPIEELDMFDAAFFGLNPREAKVADPQFRLLMESAYLAIEDSRHPLVGCSDRVGVYVGSGVPFYRSRFIDNNREMANDAFLFKEFFNQKDYSATTLSYYLDLTGPSLSINTACSTSLVAVHQACLGLNNFECDYALAGGSSLQLYDAGYVYQEGSIFSKDGYCRTFDAGATGTIFTDGVGVVVLKRYEDALRDGDRVHAVVLGTAVNNDGNQKVGFSAPSSLGQSRVIYDAIRRAEVSAEDITAVEAHGTGTVLGDPIEIEGLARAFKAFTSSRQYCAVGSIKTNIGHANSASGIAGFIKMAMSVREGIIPASLNFSEPNPSIDFEQTPFYVNTEAREWRTEGVPRIGSVSSFGIGGTNAHVVVCQPLESERQSGERHRGAVLLPLSARSTGSLQRQSEAYGELLLQENDVARVCENVALSRSHFSHRLALVGSCAEDLHKSLARVSADESLRTSRNPNIAFVFSGQGSQYAGMGKELYERWPEFKAAVDECDAALQEEIGVSVWAVMQGDCADVDNTRFTQPALFTFQVALARLWRSWGIEPIAVLGHSIGEYAAAVEAGVWTAEDAAKLVARRGRLMDEFCRPGAMLSAALEPEDLREYSAEGLDFDIAAINGPRSVVVSGDEDCIERLEARLLHDGVKVQRLAVSHGFHSSLMEPALAPLGGALESVTFSKPTIRFISSCTGREETGELADPAYWLTQMRDTVQFRAATRQLFGSDIDCVVEIGPGTTLTALLHANAKKEAEDISLLPSVKRAKGEQRAVLESLAALYNTGADIRWGEVYPGGSVDMSLPAYPFDRASFWVEPDMDPSATSGYMVSGEATHELLGARSIAEVRSSPYINAIGVSSPAYLLDHQLFNSSIFPAAGYVELALALGRDQFSTDQVEIADIRFENPMLFSGEELRTLHVIPGLEKGGRMDFQIASYVGSEVQSSNKLVAHASGTIKTHDSRPPRLMRIEAERAKATDRFGPESLYSLKGSYEYGPAFQGIQEFFRFADKKVLLARIRLPEIVDLGDDYLIHPVLLDSVFQISGLVLSHSNATRIPVGVSGLRLFKPAPRDVWAHVQHLPRSGRIRIRFTDDAGEPVAEIASYRIKEIGSSDDDLVLNATRSLLFDMTWVPQEPDMKLLDAPRKWAVVGDGTFATGLVDELTRRGHTPLQVNCRDAAQVADRAADAFGEEDNLGVILAVDGDEFDGARSGCSAALACVQSLAADASRPDKRLMLATRGSQSISGSGLSAYGQVIAGSVWGLLGSASFEHPELKIVRVDVDPDEASGFDSVMQEVALQSLEDRIGYRNGQRMVPRIMPEIVKHQSELLLPDRPFRLAMSEAGSFDNFYADAIRIADPADDEVTLAVKASSLNFKDTLMALGLIPLPPLAEIPVGMECAGTVIAVGAEVKGLSAGDSVMCMGRPSLRTHMNVKDNQVAKLPPGVSFEEGAGLPIVYMTAIYGLRHLAKLKSGDKVLIHAGAGGVGQAAIQVARAAGAEVYATASEHKHDFVRKLGVLEVFDSRSLSFAEDLLAATDGEGVDVVLNSFSGDFITRGFDCLARGGRFIEIGKLDIWSPTQAKRYRPDVSYFAFELGEVFSEKSGAQAALYREIYEGFEAGDLRPPTTEVYDAAEVTEALRHLSGGKNIGKVVLTIPDTNPAAVRPLVSDPDAACVVTGGLGGIGRAVTDLLISGGAKRIVVTSRSAADAESEGYLQDLRQKFNVEIVHMRADVSDISQVEAMFADIRGRGWTTKGVYHCAGVLDDGVVSRMTPDKLDTVMAPKVDGVLNLHKGTADLDLDHFVLFSSTAVVFGSGGQANYSAANAFLDGFAHWRRARGLNATSVNWGGWAGDGMASTVAGSAGRQDSLIQPVQGCLALQYVLEEDLTCKVATMQSWGSQELPPLLSYFSDDPSAGHSGPTELQIRMGENPEASVSEIVCEIVNEAIRLVIGAEADDAVDPNLAFVDLGVDSLMQVEFRNKLQLALGVTLSSETLFEHNTPKALMDHVCGLIERSGELADAQGTGELAVLLNGHTDERPPIFAIPGSGDHVYGFNHFAAEFEGERSVYGLRVYWRDDDGDWISDLNRLATLHFDRIRELQPAGPYVIVAHSAGSQFALELTQRLEAEGEDVRLLVLDGPAPRRTFEVTTERDRIAVLNQYVPFEVEPTREAFVSIMRAMLELYEVQWKEAYFDMTLGFAQYMPERTIRAPVKLLRAETSKNHTWDERDLGWSARTTGGVNVESSEADHFTILAKRYIAQSVEAARSLLSDAEADSKAA